MVLASFSRFCVCSTSVRTLFYKSSCRNKDFVLWLRMPQSLSTHPVDRVNDRKIDYGEKEDEV